MYVNLYKDITEIAYTLLGHYLTFESSLLSEFGLLSQEAITFLYNVMSLALERIVKAKEMKERLKEPLLHAFSQFESGSSRS